MAADLHPYPEINAAFDRLVELCATADEQTSRDVLAHSNSAGLMRSLREVSARGETCPEQHWAHEAAGAEDAWSALKRLPHLDNHRDLLRIEIVAASAVGPRTALGGRAGQRSAAADRAPARPRPRGAGGQRLLRRRGVRTLHADAAEAGTPEEDLPVLAALVGQDSAAKRPVLEALARALRPDATLLARSARRLRTALYPRISPEELHGFRPLLEVHTWDEVVNPVLVARPGLISGC